MYYAINHGNNRHIMGITMLITVGAVIGVCLGLYVAAETLPLPKTDYYYMTGNR